MLLLSTEYYLVMCNSSSASEVYQLPILLAIVLSVVYFFFVAKVAKAYGW